MPIPMQANDYDRLLTLVADCDPEAEEVLASLPTAQAARIIREAYAKAGRLDTLRELVAFLTGYNRQ